MPRDADGPGIDDRLRRAQVKARLFGKQADSLKIGPYEVVERIGRGGMGSVFRAVDPKSGTQVAVKVLRGASPKGDSRMWREARALRAIDHASVVRFLDFGSTEQGAYFVMELVEGQTLRAWLGDEHSVETILEVFLLVAAGLAAAHDKGLVHRDLKPDNIVVRPDGTPTILDFGLAKALPGSEAEAMTGMAQRLTASGATLGTFGYVSPEQLEGRAIDERTDQFAYCVCLYEALCGRLPFEGANGIETGLAVLAGTPPPRPADAKVPPAIFDAIEVGLSSDPAKRHPSVRALADVIRSTGLASRPAGSEPT